MYPVDVLYHEAQQQLGQSKLYAVYGSMIDKIDSARSAVQKAETFVDDYASWIPDPIVQIVQWEKEKREKMETMAQDEFKQYVDNVYKPLVNKAFVSIVANYANASVLNQANVKVTDVTLPDLDHKEEAFIGIEAEYELKLNIPFYRKTVHIRKKAYERAWVGAG
jgi:hypothetical protein